MEGNGMGLLGWGYGEGDKKVSAFRDAFDGGGRGRSGDEFVGGALSGVLNTIGVRPHGFNDRQNAPQQSPRPVYRGNRGGGGGGGGHPTHVQDNPAIVETVLPPQSQTFKLAGLLDQNIAKFVENSLRNADQPQGMFTNPPYGEMGPRNPNVSLRMPSLRDPYVSGLQPINRPSFQAVPNPYERGFELPPHLFR